jgi:hypothetical protein
MTWIVIPVGSGDICPVERIIAVDIDIDGSAAPVASPPQRTPGNHPDAKPESPAGNISRRIPVVRRIGGIGPAAINHSRIIGRNIDHFGVGLFDNDDCLLFSALSRDCLFFDFLLFCRCKITGFISSHTKPLNRIENIFLLSQEGIAKLLRPSQIVIHHLQYLRESSQRFDTWIPRLWFHGVFKGVSGYIRIFL